ncbi:hypothetical protein GXP67_31515 [Rhodocytophaga rosea]|uniref:Uncharacterized protein n=1 Tax=Rhodocytophaga rosea TaxID=2704465 RepID=A0A6C0GRY5_9BACT|nr:hypothetical protein [Rhodocytophaga rosea]QHT70855.1 hypothetical protein GXP67_31515 [Rhodocytophaga rosea]
MKAQAYIELLQPSLQDAPRLSILKSKYNRVAIRLNGFYQILSGQQIREGLTKLKYFQQEINTYTKF